MGTRSVVALAAGSMLASAALGVITSATASAAPAEYQFAPYVDLSANSASMLDTAISGAGVKSYTAAFIISSGCKPIWGDTLGVESSTANAKIKAAEAAGAKAIISFGGAGGVELGQACNDVNSLTAAYQSVIDAYKVDHLDFDIEGAALANTAVNDRRSKAIKTLQSSNPGLKVSLTIPVLEDGPTADGTALIKNAVDNGVKVDVVNAMTMDYGHPVADMGAAAISAAKGTLAAAKSAGMNATFANIGITPMIGNNDTPGETITLENAKQIVEFANSNGVGRLSFWSIGRDQPCPGGGVSANCSGLGGSALDFTKAFQGANPSNPGQPAEPTTAPATTEPTAPSTEQPTDPGTVQPTDPGTVAPTYPGPGGTTAPGTVAPTSPDTDGPGSGQPGHGGGKTSWKPNHAYKTGDTVTYDGVTYTCRQGHTTLQGWEPPIVLALWLPA